MGAGESWSLGRITSGSGVRAQTMSSLFVRVLFLATLNFQKSPVIGELYNFMGTSQIQGAPEIKTNWGLSRLRIQSVGCHAAHASLRRLILLSIGSPTGTHGSEDSIMIE